MLLSYEARLRRDLLSWQESGLIDGPQRERIEREAFGRRGLAGLQAVLVLCIVILLASATSAFVAANWAGMSAVSRMAVLGLGNAAAVALTFWLVRRHATAPSAGLVLAAEAAASLSLALATLSIALVAQTFHLPSDPRGFARTVAVLGLATSLVARSRVCALVGAAALLVAAVELPGLGPPSLARDDGPGFWVIGTAFFVASLGGWLPARTASLLLLLCALTLRLGGASASGLGLSYRAELVFTVALAAFGSGQVLARLTGEGLRARVRDGGTALGHAAAGLCLAAILAASVRTLGWSPHGTGLLAWPALLAGAAATASLVVPWRAGRAAAPPLADLVVLGATLLSLLLLLVGSGTGAASRGGSPVWTVWAGIVPALALVVAAHLDGRRTLYGWSLAVVAGLVIGLLVVSRDLIGFSANLLGSAILVSITVAICRWADRRLAGRPT